MNFLYHVISVSHNLMFNDFINKKVIRSYWNVREFSFVCSGDGLWQPQRTGLCIIHEDIITSSNHNVDPSSFGWNTWDKMAGSPVSIGFIGVWWSMVIS